MQHINYCSHAVQLTFNCHKGGGSQGRIQDFKLGGGRLKQLRRAEVISQKETASEYDKINNCAMNTTQGRIQRGAHSARVPPKIDRKTSSRVKWLPMLIHSRVPSF
jgi:protein subunit release factor B